MSFNTASSFVTNTNWQYYGGETTLSYFSQMAGLTVENFVTPAVGICAFLALTRGIISRSGEGLGNFWQDLIRSLYYVLLPLSIIVALILVSQGVAADPRRRRDRGTLEGANQTLALGPVASQIAIKQLGTNGGGFFNVNSSMPFENPTTALELRRGPVDHPDPGGARLHVRAHGRAHAPGLGDLRDDAGRLGRARRHDLPGRAARHAGRAQGRESHHRSR